MNELRDQKLADIQKQYNFKVRPINYFSRDELEEMRDPLRSKLRKKLGTKGRPMKARVMYEKGLYPSPAVVHI